MAAKTGSNSSSHNQAGSGGGGGQSSESASSGDSGSASENTPVRPQSPPITTKRCRRGSPHQPMVCLANPSQESRAGWLSWPWPTTH
ncbi:hypothetical protein MRX96_055744 [Rhipicephalus microplus]